MVYSRANADHPNMGLRTWKGDNVTQADVDVSKNYLAEGAGEGARQTRCSLTRISHSVEAHRGANQRKFFC
jgi:hypothetical protein